MLITTHQEPGQERRRGRSAARRMGCVLLCLSLPPRAFSAEGPVLVLNVTNAPPFTNAEGTGYADIVAAEAFRRAGLGLRLVEIPSERGLRLANEGTADGDLGRIEGMEQQYPNLVRVPESFVRLEFAAFAKDPAVPPRLESLRSRRVGIVRGWKVYEDALSGAPDVVRADDPSQLFLLLQKDRIEVALYERWMGLALLQKQGETRVRPLQPPLAVRDLFVYLNRRHAARAAPIAAALRAMKAEGFCDRVYRERVLPLVNAVGN